MQLLVSVRDREEALSALAGGASIIDAKDPSAGALGAVSLDTFRAIVEAVHSERPISAALGDADTEGAVTDRARAFAAAGAAFVKIGFAGIDDESWLQELAAAAVRGAVPARAAVVGVAYADHAMVAALSPDAILSALARAGAQGVLLDTAAKNGGGVCSLFPPDRLRAWIRRAKQAGLFVAIAGQLQRDDLARVAACGADIAGVRGAACDGGRVGIVRAATVRALVEASAGALTEFQWR
jgi:uncharacterized protein (UPF0264 family)